MAHAKDIFESTAHYYSVYRPGYPDVLYSHLVERYHLDGRGRLLDLGCGTGQLTFPLSAHFAQVVAMDPEPEMIEEGKRQAAAREAFNIQWSVGGSGEVDPKMGSFRLVTLGRSFHWTDRDALLLLLHEMVEPGGGVVIINDPGVEREVTFHQVTQQVVTKFLGEQRRAGSSYYSVSPERHEVIIARSPFRRVETFKLRYTRTWTIDEIVGHCYSTSYCSVKVLGERREAFERELRERLRRLTPAGAFSELVEVEAFLLFRDSKLLPPPGLSYDPFQSSRSFTSASCSQARFSFDNK